VQHAVEANTRWSRVLFPGGRAVAIALLSCVVVPVALVGLQLHHYPRFSPLDEAAHLDYVDRVADGAIPRQGQHLRAQTLREVACRGSALGGVAAPPCSAPVLRSAEFPAGASQYEAQQPPPYYVVTAAIRLVTRHVLGVDNELLATRLTSVVWLVAGLLLAWAAGRLMEVEPVRLGIALLLLAAGPTVIFLSATVSNDVTAVPAGALVALAAAVAHRRPGTRASLLLFLAGVVAAAGKTTNLFAVATMSAVFAVAALGDAELQGAGARLRRWGTTGGALLLGGVTVSVAWLAIHSSLALIDLKDEPAFAGLRQAPHGFGRVLGEATALLQPLTSDIAVSLTSPSTLGTDAQAPLHTMLGLVFVAAGLAGLFVVRRQWPHVLGLVSTAALYGGGVAFGAGLLLTYGGDPGLSGRYGLSVAPLLALALAGALAGPWAVRAAGAFALVLVGVTFVAMLT
jgi:hypothetical protein